MNSPMREVGPSQRQGSRVREDGPRHQRQPEGRHAGRYASGYAGDPAGGPGSHASEPVGEPAAAADAAPGDESLVHASGVMAAGTLVSRVTGFLRTAVIAYALGTAAVADAYNNANTFPNAVFDLLLGGILTSVFVPLLVNAARRVIGARP